MSYFVCDQCEKRHSLFGEEGGRILAKKFSTELLAKIPIVQPVREGGDEGRPIVVREPDSEIAQIFRSLARKVAQQVSIRAHQNFESPIVQIGKFN